MKPITVLIAVAVAVAGHHYWAKHAAETAPGEVAAASGQSDNGFVAMPPFEGGNPRSVLVIAAEGCPEEAAQRADRLAEDLARAGVPAARTHSVSFTMNDASEADRVVALMNGELPIVLVKGRAKSNPTLDEVVAEYRATR